MNEQFRGVERQVSLEASKNYHYPHLGSPASPKWVYRRFAEYNHFKSSTLERDASVFERVATIAAQRVELDMSWSYRIVRYANDRGYGLHEVHYDENGLPWGMTEKPISFVCDVDEGPQGIKESLSMAIEAVSQLSVFDEPIKDWPGKRPS